jgi:hypothetical protein
MSLPSCLTLRTVKGSVLSWAELDNNFICLNNLINTKNGFGGNRWYIPSGETITVESDYQYFFYGDIIVDGLLQLSGNSQLVVLNGDIITTGGTIDGTGSIYNIDLPTFDTKVTGLTYSGDVLTIYQNDGSSYSATVITSTDITITGGTYDPVTGVATFYNNVGGNFPVTGFLTGYTDVQVSDLNYVGQTLVLNQTNGTSFSATTPSYTFTGNTSGDCITDLFVSNVNSCSPLHIQPLNTGDVYIGENGGVNVGIGVNSPSAKLHINNTTTGNTIIFEDDTSPDPSPFVIDNGGKVGIGTTTPSEKLDVYNGFIKTNQGVIVDGGTNNGVRFNGSGFSRFVIDSSYKLNSTFTEGFKFTNGVYDFFNYDQSGLNGDSFQIGNGLIKGKSTGTTNTDVYLGINVLGTPSSTLHIVGKDSLSSNYGLKVQNSGGTDNLVVRNDGNVGIGTSNPSKKLEVSGGDALINDLTVGRGAGDNITNSVLGYQSLFTDINSSGNTAIGYQSLYNNADNNYNTAIGYKSMYNHQSGGSGDGNTSIGSESLFNSKTSEKMTSVGYKSFYNVENGINSVKYGSAVGFESMFNTIEGDGNTSLGYQSGYNNLSGGGLTIIGAFADVGVSDLSNATAIGYGAIVSKSNSLILGNNADVGIGTSTPTSKLDISGTNGYEQLRLRTSYTPTGSTDSNGNIGDVAWDDNYFYWKTSTQWLRISGQTW